MAISSGRPRSSQDRNYFGRNENKSSEVRDSKTKCSTAQVILYEITFTLTAPGDSSFSHSTVVLFTCAVLALVCRMPHISQSSDGRAAGPDRDWIASRIARKVFTEDTQEPERSGNVEQPAQLIGSTSR